MAKITKVPNGPLIKKKGSFKGSTLKNGGTTTTQTTTPVKKPTWQEMTQAERAAIKINLGPEKFKTYKDSVSTDATNRREAILNRNAAARGMTRAEVQADQEKNKNKYTPQENTCDPNFSSTKCKISKEAAKNERDQWGKRKNGGPVKKAKAGAMIKRAQNGESYTKDDKGYTYTKQVTRPEGKRTYEGKSIDQSMAKKIADYKIRNNPSDSVKTVKPVIRKNGGLIKRADGSMSRRGLWDNIRANKGSGKKPTKQMLVQEKKIKAKSKK
jgi:hypothetical protein